MTLAARFVRFALFVRTTGLLWPGYVRRLAERIHGSFFRCDSRLPYQIRRFLLSPGELAFFNKLRCVLPERCAIGLKVRLADVITCPRDSWDAGYGRAITFQHLDFVLYDPLTTRILLAIELDDRSHARRRRRELDALLDRAVCGAGLPLVRFTAKPNYDAAVIGRAIRFAPAIWSMNPVGQLSQESRLTSLFLFGIC